MFVFSIINRAEILKDEKKLLYRHKWRQISWSCLLSYNVLPRNLFLIIRRSLASQNNKLFKSFYQNERGISNNSSFFSRMINRSPYPLVATIDFSEWNFPLVNRLPQSYRTRIKILEVMQRDNSVWFKSISGRIKINFINSC